MKKILIFGVVVSFLAGFSLPAAALEVDFSGDFYVEGILNSNQNMLDDDKTTDYRQMRLRVKTDFSITDNLTLTTRFDALEKVLSSKDSAFDEEYDDPRAQSDTDDENIDFDRAYLSYISPIGLFQVGRMKGVTWGTSFCDDETDTDRIKYVLPIPLDKGKLYIGAVAEKVTERDHISAASDEDNDKYYIGLTYKANRYSTGLLTAFYNYRYFQDPGQAVATKNITQSYDENGNLSDYQDYLSSNDQSDDISGYATWYGTGAQVFQTAYGQALAGGLSSVQAQQAAADAVATTPVNAAGALVGSDWVGAMGDGANSAVSTFSERDKTCQAGVVLLAPYFEGKFGDFGVTAELDYIFGTVEYDTAGVEDRDVKAFGYFAEGSYDFGPLTVQGGFAHVSGDADYTDEDVESMGYVSPGLDWGKLFILNADDHGMNASLGDGVGNHVGSGYGTASTAMLDGYQMFYAGADYAVTDSLSLGFIGALSKADDVPAGPGYDDDQGIEYDLSLTWDITDNLQYKGICAFLDGGDYWETRANGGVSNPNIDADIYTLYHKLTLTF